MAHQCAAIPHTWCNRFKNAVAEYNSATADVSVPNLRSKGAHASPSLLAHAAGRGWGSAKTPRAASCLLMGSRPQWPPFGAKPRSCKYSYGVSPGFPPGSFYPPATQRSSARRVIQCIIFLFIIYHCTGPCQPFSRAQPQNVPRQPGPPPKLPRRGHVTPGFVTLLR